MKYDFVRNSRGYAVFACKIVMFEAVAVSMILLAKIDIFDINIDEE